MRPPVIRPGGSGISRSSDSALALLPEPLSPTIATVSPRSTVNETPLTAGTLPSPVRNSACKSTTSSNGTCRSILPFATPLLRLFSRRWLLLVVVLASDRPCQPFLTLSLRKATVRSLVSARQRVPSGRPLPGKLWRLVAPFRLGPAHRSERYPALQ